MDAGLGPLSGGWRLLGRESVKILGIRFRHCNPGLCLERESIMAGAAVLGGERWQCDRTHATRSYRQVPSLGKSQ